MMTTSKIIALHIRNSNNLEMCFIKPKIRKNQNLLHGALDRINKKIQNLTNQDPNQMLNLSTRERLMMNLKKKMNIRIRRAHKEKNTQVLIKIRQVK